MKGKNFRLQLDEATDAHLICYIRFLDNIIVENWNNLGCEKCIVACTDGTR